MRVKFSTKIFWFQRLYDIEIFDKNTLRRNKSKSFQFFIDPLMGEDAVDREMQAVNSEFEISKKNDGTRIAHIMKAKFTI